MSGRRLWPLLLVWALAACNLPGRPLPASTREAAAPSAAAAATLTASPSPGPIATPTVRPSSTPTPTVRPSSTPTPMVRPSPTPAPTATPAAWTVLRAEVLERANCRYGPGWPYLYKYGLVPGSVLEAIGRLDDASWLWVQAIGGDNPCWVKASLMEVRGDVWTLEPVYPEKAPLPVSPYFPPLGNVRAVRQGDQVTITWTRQYRSPGFSEGPNSPVYVVEIWACQDGELRFTPYGLFTETLTVTDEPGCDRPSQGRLYFAEKHGYAGPTLIPWPPYDD